MSTEEFKDTLAKKGWTLILVARRWDVSKTRMSQIANDEMRSAYYDDGVRGLPDLTSLAGRRQASKLKAAALSAKAARVPRKAK